MKVSIQSNSLEDAVRILDGRSSMFVVDKHSFRLVSLGMEHAVLQASGEAKSDECGAFSIDPEILSAIAQITGRYCMDVLFDVGQECARITNDLIDVSVPAYRYYYGKPRSPKQRIKAGMPNPIKAGAFTVRCTDLSVMLEASDVSIHNEYELDLEPSVRLLSFEGTSVRVTSTDRVMLARVIMHSGAISESTENLYCVLRHKASKTLASLLQHGHGDVRIEQCKFSNGSHGFMFSWTTGGAVTVALAVKNTGLFGDVLKHASVSMPVFEPSVGVCSTNISSVLGLEGLCWDKEPTLPVVKLSFVDKTSCECIARISRKGFSFDMAASIMNSKEPRDIFINPSRLLRAAYIGGRRLMMLGIPPTDKEPITIAFDPPIPGLELHLMEMHVDPSRQCSETSSAPG